MMPSINVDKFVGLTIVIIAITGVVGFTLFLTTGFFMDKEFVINKIDYISQHFQGRGTILIFYVYIFGIIIIIGGLISLFRLLFELFHFVPKGVCKAIGSISKKMGKGIWDLCEKVKQFISKTETKNDNKKPVYGLPGVFKLKEIHPENISFFLKLQKETISGLDLYASLIGNLVLILLICLFVLVFFGMEYTFVEYQKSTIYILVILGLLLSMAWFKYRDRFFNENASFIEIIRELGRYKHMHFLLTDAYYKAKARKGEKIDLLLENMRIRPFSDIEAIWYFARQYGLRDERDYGVYYCHGGKDCLSERQKEES